MDTTNRHDYKMKGFELEKLRPVLQLAAGQLLEKVNKGLKDVNINIYIFSYLGARIYAPDSCSSCQ